MNGFPYLPLLIAIPLVGAAVVASMGRSPARTVKMTALGFSLVELVLTIALWVAFRHSQSADVGAPITAGIQDLTTTVPGGTAAPFSQTFSVSWIPSFGVTFSLGVDGI